MPVFLQLEDKVASNHVIEKPLCNMDKTIETGV